MNPYAKMQKCNTWILIVCLIIGLLFPATVYAADFYFFGLNGKWLKEANWKHVALGAVSSVATHVAGHAIYAYSTGMDVTFHDFGTQETVDGDYSDSKMQGFARAGFVLQHGVNLTLASFERSREWDFTKGFSVMTAIETLTYKMRHGDDGDFDMIDRHGGDGDREHLFFCALCAHEILRIEW